MANQDSNSMQKAYLDLLQQKMNSDAALLNNQQHQYQHPHQSMGVLPKMGSHPQQQITRKTPTPMRMKIHIYPNADQEPTERPQITLQNNPPNQHQYQSNPQSHSGYYSPNNGDGSTSYSSNTVPLLSPRYPQKVAGTLNGNTVMHLSGPGPAPSIHLTRPGNGNTMMTMHNNNQNMHVNPYNNNNGEGSLSDKNKNLVLHLHVHRRNDVVGPVELEAEASDHFVSTDKPLINYK
jgi:hypothetical protein